jgi:hypothetical protein
VTELEARGYRSVGFRGSDRSFFTPGSLVHVFCKPLDLAGLSDKGVGSGKVCCPLVFRHDLSFWIDDALSFAPSSLEAFLSAQLGPLGVSFASQQFDAYREEVTGRSSRGFHVDIWAEHRPLTKVEGNSIMRAVGAVLASEGFEGARQGQGRYRYDVLPVSRGGTLTEEDARAMVNGRQHATKGASGRAAEEEAGLEEADLEEADLEEADLEEADLAP